MPIRVIIAGATGRVGRELLRRIGQEPDLQLVGAVARHQVGLDAGLAAGLGPLGVALSATVAEVLEAAPADVLVDFTRAEAAATHIRLALGHGVRPVVGTTGFSAEDLSLFERLAREAGLSLAVIPNFSLGAVLLMRLAEQARRYFPHVELIEMHHETKLDAPSGTAARLAVRLGRASGLPVPIHSVRLPGLVAHHLALFGGPGETLTLRHDSTSRESFVPGVFLAVRRIGDVEGIVLDLDAFLDLPS